MEKYISAIKQAGEEYLRIERTAVPRSGRLDQRGGSQNGAIHGCASRNSACLPAR